MRLMRNLWLRSFFCHLAFLGILLIVRSADAVVISVGYGLATVGTALLALTFAGDVHAAVSLHLERGARYSSERLAKG